MRMSGGGLDWREDRREGLRIVAPVGRVDESTASAFTEQLVEAAAAGGMLIVDLGGIAYMSSRGLRALTLAQRRGSEAGTSIVLAAPNETMREILAISRYDMVFRVVETVEDAIAG